MNLVAIMPVRNEEWILGFSARVALLWCDMLICLNHDSIDETRVILQDLSVESGGRVIIADSYEPGWPEMEHRQKLLDLARNYRASHIALIDADEVLCGDSLSFVRKQVETLAPGRVLQVRMYCMWRGLHQYRTDPGSVWSNRNDLALAFADVPRLEFAATNGYQHHARAPRGSVNFRNATATPLGVMHLQFADWRRLAAKHALYKVRERVTYPERPVSQIESMYNMALDEQGIKVDHAPIEWLQPYRQLIQYIHFKRDPWQADEARRIYQAHDPALFKGLTLFGVCG